MTNAIQFASLLAMVAFVTDCGATPGPSTVDAFVGDVISPTEDTVSDQREDAGTDTNSDAFASADFGCEGLNPSSLRRCRPQLCPEGYVCPPGTSPCVSSDCQCDPLTNWWLCLEDCNGGSVTSCVLDGDAVPVGDVPEAEVELDALPEA